MFTSFRISIAALGLVFAAHTASAQPALSFAQQAKPRNIIEMIFGAPKSAPVNEFVPPTPPSSLPVSALPGNSVKKAATGGSSPRGHGGGGSLAVCVRTCDGFFFPVNYEGARGSDRYEEACQASCPAAQTEVYFMPQGADLYSAANAKGRNYTQLANAFKYRETRDPACTCKDANQTWAQVLAPAEALVRHNKNDVVVTPEASDLSVRPKQPVVANASKDKVASAAPVKPAAE